MATPVDPGGGSEEMSVQGIPSEASGDLTLNVSENHPVIVDGLLCSIIRAMSNTNRDDELVAAIGSEMLEQEIKTSWVKLFNFYKDVLDENRKIPIVDIKRQTVRAMVEDIVSCLRKKDAVNDLKVFVLPWYYSLQDFPTESQKVDQAWKKETLKETEKKS